MYTRWYLCFVASSLESQWAALQTHEALSQEYWHTLGTCAYTVEAK